VFVRDNHTCGYCGIQLNSSNRTLDHVLPVSKGGKTTYKNIISSCLDCNSFKGNKTLEEMEKKHGWKMLHQLKDPNEDILYHVPPHKILKSWEPFLSKR
jgi:5-methylcytosine-specific restriction endonuclease McrA